MKSEPKFKCLHVNTQSASNVPFVKIPQFYLGFTEDSPIHPTFGEIQCQLPERLLVWVAFSLPFYETRTVAGQEGGEA